MKWEFCTQHVIDYYLAIVWQMPNFACYSYWYLKIAFNSYSMLVYDYYTRKIWLQVMGLVHRQDYGDMGIIYEIYALHVADVVTWRLYHLHNFKLRAWYNTLSNRDCEHEVILYQNFSLATWFSDIIGSYLFLRISVDIAFQFLCN